ncbi:MAG: ABC transporter permease [Verrucomicrobia bacterium]|nr:MAG: ABC transporter permease [Verrucomicrobiota bacterium]
MTFFTIVLRSLTRRPVRTGLTLVGISIGIAAVVTLVGMAWGYEKGVANQLDAVGTDVVVSNMSGGLMPKVFNESLKAKVATLPRVVDATSILMQMLSVEDAPIMMISGREWGGFAWQKMSLLEGRMPKNAAEKAVVLGTLAAEVLKKKVGDTVQIEVEELPVVGIVDGHALMENGTIFLSLKVMQEVTGNDGKINFVNIRAIPNTSKAQINQLCRDIHGIFPEGRAMVSTEVVGTSQGFRVIRAISWSTSLLAIIVGVLGVMNTMLMTVFERTHEIGILLAVGWRRRRIVAMVLCESALLGLLGGLVGVGLGVLGLVTLGASPGVRGFIEPDLNPQLMLISIAISVVVGVISGLYPAWRSSRLTPSVALQS